MVPETSDTPVHLIPNWRKRFADQYDRDWELYSYNHHPVALEMFRKNNEEIREIKEDQEIRKSGKKTLEDQYSDFICENIKE